MRLIAQRSGKETRSTENPVTFPDTRTKRQKGLTREEIPISTHATKSPYNNTEGIFPPCCSSCQHNDTEDFFSRVGSPRAKDKRNRATDVQGDYNSH